MRMGDLEVSCQKKMKERLGPNEFHVRRHLSHMGISFFVEKRNKERVRGWRVREGGKGVGIPCCL